MNKLLILSVMAFFAALMPVVPALACFPESEEILFQTEQQVRSSSSDFDEDYAFGRDPLPMSFCESGEHGFVIVNSKCYDQDAITDFDDDKDCEADEICSAYREEQRKQQEQEEHYKCPADTGADCTELKSLEEQEIERTDDPNHGEIKGDEELEQDEEEHQEEEEQGEEKGESQETTQETAE